MLQGVDVEGDHAPQTVVVASAMDVDSLPVAVGLVDEETDLLVAEVVLAVVTLARHQELPVGELRAQERVGIAVDVVEHRERELVPQKAHRLRRGLLALEVALPRLRAHEERASEEDSGPGDLAAVDRLLDGKKSLRRTTRLPHAGDALHQVVERPVGHTPERRLPSLLELFQRKTSLGGGIERVELDVLVGVDEPGEDGHLRSVDDLSAFGDPQVFPRPHPADAIALDQDRVVEPCRGPGSVDEHPSHDGDGRSGHERRLRRAERLRGRGDGGGEHPANRKIPESSHRRSPG